MKVGSLVVNKENKGIILLIGVDFMEITYLVLNPGHSFHRGYEQFPTLESLHEWMDKWGYRIVE